MKRGMVSTLASSLSILGSLASLFGILFFLQKSLHMSELAVSGITVIVSGLFGIFSGYLVKLIKKVRVAPRVFLSYSHANQATAEKLSETLRAHGVRVWLDSERMKPGDEIRPMIERAISDTDTFLALLSGRPSPNLSIELGLARAKGLRVIPVLLEGAQIPSDLKDLRYIDLRDFAHGLSELVEAVT
jgi:hypothetical protein